jgi:ADP-ribose pyrophosphatase YjhB (NUDIX family)
MSDSIVIVTVAVVYNSEHKLLVCKRSSKEQHAPGVLAYPGGRLEFNYREEEFDVLEKNTAREVKEETGYEAADFKYISTHAFIKKNGEQTIVVAYLARLAGGELKLDPDEVSASFWMTPQEIAAADMFDAVHQVYAKAAEILAHEYYQIVLGGLVINDKHQFLLVRSIDGDKQGMFTYPKTELSLAADSSWEAMEQCLAKGIYAETEIEIDDGSIPFTDQAFVNKDNFETLIQFFICKYKFGKPVIAEPSKVSDISWLKFADFDRSLFGENDYLVFAKAAQFITNLSN